MTGYLYAILDGFLCRFIAIECIFYYTVIFMIVDGFWG